MKSTFVKCIAAALFFTIAACNNDTDEKETKTTPVEATPEKKEKTEISVGPDGGEVKTKDANVKIVTKDTTKK